MISERKENLEMLKDLPYETTLTDEKYLEYMHSKLKRSKDDIKKGRVISLEESKERIRKKYADFNDR